MISAYAFAASLVVLVVVLAQLPYATARLARLLPRDSIATRVRTWVREKWGRESTQAEFVTCHWCTAVWASLLTNSFGWTVIAITGLLSPLMCVLLAAISVPATAYQASRMIDREDG